MKHTKPIGRGKEHYHKKRFILDLFGESCQCPFSFNEVSVRAMDGEMVDIPEMCQQRDFLNTKATVAGTFGENVFLCGHCKQNHGRKVANWSKGRRDFINKVAVEDPALLQTSMDAMARVNRK